MRKKVYKKKKKVIAKLIYQRKNQPKKLNPAAFLLIFILFFFTTGNYYLIFSSLLSFPLLYASHTSPSRNISTSNNKSDKSITFPASLQNIVSAHKVTPPQDQIIWHGPRNKKEIALTFDADMTPVMVDWLHSGQVKTYDDPGITDYLTHNDIKATFFLTGLWIESYPDATKELADNPLFELENHSYSHPSMAGYCFDQPQIPENQYPFEIEKTQQLIKQYTHESPKYFRFPGGCYNQADLSLVKKEGLHTVHWDDVANDGFNNNEDEIIQNVLSEARNGSIIVMHIGGQPNVPVTADALPTIVEGLKNKGFTFVTVSELLNPPKIVAKINPKKYLTSLQSFQNIPLE